MDNLIIEKEVLQDVKNGKEVKWSQHKLKGYELSDSYYRIAYKTLDSGSKIYLNKAFRVERCGLDLEFEVYEDGSKHLKNATFCKVRLCPMCAWRRSLKVFGQTSKVMDYLTANYDYRYIFVSLTVKNVEGFELTDEMDKLFAGFKDLAKKKEFKALSKGWFRCLEVTHNWKDNTYHPHLHLVIAVSKSYFDDSRVYLSHEKWMKLWRSCMKLDYDPQVDVRAVKQDSDGNYSKAVAEVAKYSAKPSDYIVNAPEAFEDMPGVTEYFNKLTDEAVEVMDLSLKNRRLVAHGGIFKEVHKKLNLDDAFDGDLINTDNEVDIRPDLNYIVVRYAWDVGFKNYYRVF